MPSSWFSSSLTKILCHTLYDFIHFREIFGDGEDINIQFDDIVWNVEVSEQEARDKLEEKFYPFKKVLTFMYV